MLTFEEARLRLLDLAGRAGPPPIEAVPLDDADGRVLAEDLLAPDDLPPFDASTMDGYALSAAGLEAALASPGEARGVLRVVGESRTGHPVSPLASGTAMRIFTGAELPSGADAVVMQERVAALTGAGGPGARFEAAARPYQCVRRRGSDLRAGELALAAGARLGPAALGVAASCDRPTLEVFARPRVTLLTTGDELVPPGAPRARGQLPESNSVALVAMARRAGATVIARRTLPDDRAATARALGEALATSELVLTVGGVSVGDHDVVRDALADAGATLDFWKVAIKPGKPLAVGARGASLFLGLPGNPASAMVTFALFGVPLLRALGGERAPLPRALTARVLHDVAHEPGRLELVRAALSVVDGALCAGAVTHQASGASLGMARADALLAVPLESAGLRAGDAAVVYPFTELGLQ
ncbi:MAG: molybdopterin molybdotransferase MoeA [Myxococcales bacterium]|nr:molybdopterin molybdotransferase MoeA [Myxococcales bacterium]